MQTMWRQLSDRMAQESPIFIVGVPRCGATALRNTLSRLPCFRSREERSPETGAFQRPERIFALREPEGEALFRYMLEDAVFAEQLLRTLGPRRRWKPALWKGLVRSLGRWSDRDELRSLSWRLDGRHHVLRVYFHYAKLARRSRRLLEKTSLHVQYLDEIFATFPLAKTLMCIRNPVDVYRSLRRLSMREHPHGVGSTGHGWERIDLDEFARRYARASGIILRRWRRQPHRCQLVRYEDLALDPALVLERVCGFLGEEFDEETLITGHDIGSADVRAPDSRTSTGAESEKRSDVLGGDEVQRVERILFGEINDFGYELST